VGAGAGVGAIGLILSAAQVPGRQHTVGGSLPPPGLGRGRGAVAWPSAR